MTALSLEIQVTAELQPLHRCPCCPECCFAAGKGQNLLVKVALLCCTNDTPPCQAHEPEPFPRRAMPQARGPGFTAGWHAGRALAGGGCISHPFRAEHAGAGAARPPAR